MGAWMERRWWWGPLVVLLGLNLLALAWYATAYSGFAKNVDQELEERRGELARLESLVERQRRVAANARHNQNALESFYTAQLGPPSERLTQVIGEVRSLARTAGLEPSAINYPEDDLADFGLVKRSFSFGVRGTYAQLRSLINLLEMTDSFLTLEEVQLTGRGSDPELRISLRVSTLFVDEDVEVATEEVAG